MNTIESWFVNPEEKQLGILGQGYLASAMRGSFSRSILVLTQERIYQRGRIFELAFNGRWIPTKGNKIVEVRSVNASAFKEISFPVFLVFSIISVLGAVAAMLIDYEEEIALTAAVTLLILAFFWFVLYFATRLSIFYIEYAGGKIGTQARWYSRDEIYEFQKALSRAVDAKFMGSGGKIVLG